MDRTNAQRQARWRQRRAAEVGQLRERLAQAEPDGRVSALEAEIARLRKQVAEQTVSIRTLEELHQIHLEDKRELRDELRRLKSGRDGRDPKDGKRTKTKGPSSLPPQVVKLIPRLGDENEHERQIALDKIGKALKGSGLNWSDVANWLR